MIPTHDPHRYFLLAYRIALGVIAVSLFWLGFLLGRVTA